MSRDVTIEIEDALRAHVRELMECGDVDETDFTNLTGDRLVGVLRDELRACMKGREIQTLRADLARASTGDLLGRLDEDPGLLAEVRMVLKRRSEMRGLRASLCCGMPSEHSSQVSCPLHKVYDDEVYDDEVYDDEVYDDEDYVEEPCCALVAMAMRFRTPGWDMDDEEVTTQAWVDSLLKGTLCEEEMRENVAAASALYRPDDPATPMDARAWMWGRLWVTIRESDVPIASDIASGVLRQLASAMRARLGHASSASLAPAGRQWASRWASVCSACLSLRLEPDADCLRSSIISGLKAVVVDICNDQGVDLSGPMLNPDIGKTLKTIAVTFDALQSAARARQDALNPEVAQALRVPYVELANAAERVIGRIDDFVHETEPYVAHLLRRLGNEAGRARSFAAIPATRELGSYEVVWHNKNIKRRRA